VIIRVATVEDFRAYARTAPPPEWCLEERIVGYVAEHDGQPVAMGIVTWDKWGRAWGWFEAREPIAVAAMHRRAVKVMRALREVGEPALYAFCLVRAAAAEKWLWRLGFVPDPELTAGHELTVWKCDLSSS